MSWRKLFIAAKGWRRQKRMEAREALKLSRPVRKFKSTPLGEQKLLAVLNAARLAPSVDNLQPYRFVVVTDEDLKARVAAACNSQRWIAQAPVLVVALAMLDEATSVVGGFSNSSPLDVGLAFDRLVVAAAAEGLGACPLFAFNEDKVRDLLQAPADARVLAITPLGYPDEAPAPEERRSLSELVAYNGFN